MTDQRVIQTAGSEQVPFYNPTQGEIRLAISTVFLEDQRESDEAPIPARVFRLIREALDRANAGEFR
ncbi:hypothetical protein ACRARG_04650 [Pseudooceanicola sp. C21-150M6]|uniref:hypothetical protein n=1 Tax=Pseudooceanicola sp. C21-150M6 TaxID=3434355 RepID=UPI003D7F99E0